MINIIYTVLSVSLISAFLAAVIAIAEKYLNNYGECEIDINNGSRKITVQGGSSLLSALSSSKIFIPSACGGKATCGLCKVRILSGAGPLLPTEEPYLSSEEISTGARLSCQIKVKNNMKILIPEELFSIKLFKARIDKITQLTHDIKQFTLSLLEPGVIEFKAGQYVQINTKPYGKITEIVSRAYSISSIPSQKNQIELIIRLVPGGICTTYYHNIAKEGDEITLSGPYGDFYLREDAKDVVFIAGGSGLAPIKSMILDIIEKKLDINMMFFFGAVSLKDLYYVDYFKQIQYKYPNFKYIPCLSMPSPEDKWDGETGLVTEVFERHINEGSNKHAYLCGSPGMINACLVSLKNKGFREENIFYDKF